MRVDKYLWAIRVYKTRSKATEACRKGRISIAEQVLKPSRELRIGEIIKVRKEAITFQYEIVDFPKSRVGAKLVQDFSKDITPTEEIEKMELIRMGKKVMSVTKRKFKGRPTKKERRDRDKFLDE
ncbi:MAG: S4 domain-containing protein [Bacteroidota bacterium]